MFMYKFWYQMKAFFMLCDMSKMNFFEFEITRSYRATSKIGSVKYHSNS